MEPMDSFSIMARIDELWRSTLARRFRGVSRVNVTDIIAALREDFPADWQAWVDHAGPGGADHLPDGGLFEPLRLTLQRVVLKLECAGDAPGFTVDEAKTAIKGFNERYYRIYLKADPLAVEHEIARRMRAGELHQFEDGRYCQGKAVTIEMLEAQLAAFEQEGERLRAELDAFEAETDFLQATGFFDDAGRPRGDPDWGKPVEAGE